MRYCPNCGNKIDDKQIFCNKCGTKLDANNKGNNDESLNTSTQKNGYESSKTKQNKRSKGKIWIIVSSVLAVIILVLVLLFTGYFFYKNVISNNDANNTFQSTESKSQNNEEVDIKVLSSEFSEDFMNEDNTGGYEGFNLGMSKEDIQQKFGKPSSSTSMDVGNVEKYGNIGIYYGIDDTISSVYVLPEDVSIVDFKHFHGEPTVETDSQLVYDDNSDNSFTIFVNIEDDKVQSIENTFQIDDEALNNMESITTTSNDVSPTFAHEAVNYSGGIGKILSTAFNAEDYTEQEEYLSKAREMVLGWDGALDDLNATVSNQEEEDIVSQLEEFKSQRDDILNNIEDFDDNSNTQAWHDAQEDYETLQVEMRIFADEYVD
ncbi:zinc-ribbon domain-containing protein [Staphylococcus equorum]|uniref:zinc-ribbon domain-containing protein n=1 Tax=Staphylococcus equorum TaxID=246432 RepID=UPI000853F063|nr:zinc ribbon domain-containing protein [Staphylococcus equorum]OEL08487.1 hypothetical protein AST04_07715 [Staphylococcus equorum]